MKNQNIHLNRILKLYPQLNILINNGYEVEFNHDIFNNLYIIAKKIIDVRPTILKAINCKNYRKSPGLFKIAERLNVKIKGEQHNALNDAVLLYGVCRELNIQMSI